MLITKNVEYNLLESLWKTRFLCLQYLSFDLQSDYGSDCKASAILFHSTLAHCMWLHLVLLYWRLTIRTRLGVS